MMTRNDFEDITIGTSVAEVEERVGSPYKIYSKPGDVEEYEYIERMNVGGDRVFQNHYYLTIIDGKVVGKHTSKERPAGFDLIYQDDPNNLGTY
jgi:hypothetical protein